MPAGGCSAHRRLSLVCQPLQWRKSPPPGAPPPTGRSRTQSGVSVKVLTFSAIQHQRGIFTSILLDAIHLFIFSSKSEIFDSSFRFWSLSSSFSWQAIWYLAWKTKTENYSKKTDTAKSDKCELTKLKKQSNSGIWKKQSTVRSLTSADRWVIVSSFWFRSERRSLVWLIRSRTTSCQTHKKYQQWLHWD